MPIAADSDIRTVLQLLSPLRCHSAEAEFHRQQPDSGKLCLRSGDRLAICSIVHVAGGNLPHSDFGQSGIPLRQDQPAVVAFPYDPAAVHPQSWPGGEENQPRSERHRPGQQSGECFPAIHQLPTDILYADNLDDFSAGAGIRFHAFPGQPAPWPDGFLYLPLRQPGQGVCDYPVHLHHPDGHGRDSGSQQDVVQPQNYLAAIKRNWHDSGHWLSGALPAAPWAGALDGVSVQ